MKKKIIIAVSAALFVIIIALAVIITGKINNANKFTELIKQNENNVKEIIEKKTNEIINYIDSHSGYSETEMYTKADLIEFKNDNKNFINIPVIRIDNDYYSLTAVNELQKSMKIISSYLVSKIKNILIKGVNDQTQIYKNNISSYADWFYSPLVRFDLAGTKLLGFLSGEKSVEEKYYADNFSRIMNRNADLKYIIKDDLDILYNIINNIFNEYLEIKNYFYVNNNQKTSDIISDNDFIEPYIYNIAVYFEQVFEALAKADIFYHHEYTIKTQETLNKSELEQKITDSMIQNQTNKIEIIKDPFNYMFDKLTVGSVLFVDNYIAGLNAFQHYGVYIGNERIIHFAPQEGQELNIANLQESFESAIIHETTLEKFLNGRALQIDLNIEKKFSENEIIRRARSRINEKGYDLFLNNCEHFARWCVTGESVSYQVKNLPQKIDETWSIIQKNYYMISDFLGLFN